MAAQGRYAVPWQSRCSLLCAALSTLTQPGECAETIFAGDTVLDAPLYIHLPKLIIWALSEGNLFALLYESYQGNAPDRPGMLP